MIARSGAAAGGASPARSALAGLPDEALRGLEQNVEAALGAGDQSALPILGYGEISLVLGWPPKDPRFACKRLPSFPTRSRFDAYGRTLDAYLDALRRAGSFVETELRPVVRDDGTVAGYVVQPVLPTDDLAPAVLGREDPDAGHPLVAAVVGAAAATVSPRVGLDAQLANWTWNDSVLTYLDVSTPLLWSEKGARFSISICSRAPSLGRCGERYGASRFLASSRPTAICARSTSTFAET